MYVYLSFFLSAAAPTRAPAARNSEMSASSYMYMYVHTCI